MPSNILDPGSSYFRIDNSKMPKAIDSLKMRFAEYNSKKPQLINLSSNH